VLAWLEVAPGQALDAGEKAIVSERNYGDSAFNSGALILAACQLSALSP
jgi:hypothetical protein